MDMMTFDPVLYSDQENEFLLQHLGESPSVALRSIRAVPLANPHRKDSNPVHYPDGVNPVAVKPILERVFELQELEKHRGESWVGVEALKAAIRTWLTESAKWAREKARNPRAPRFPSLYSFDAKGKPHLSGPGSDSGQVRTFFDSKGNRQPFAVRLIGEYVPEWTFPVNTETGNDHRFFEDGEKCRFECKVLIEGQECGHTESYKAGSRSSRAAARARMSRHLRKPKNGEVDQHMEVYTNEFGG